MSNRKTVSRIALASLALVIISSVTFASPWSVAMDWLGLGQPAAETAAPVQEAPEALVTTVTTNGGSGLAGSYADLATAITALNAATITSPVVITVSGTETAPAGGYSITATGTAVNTITLNGGGAGTTVITAAPAPTIGSRTDAIFKIIGGDFITLDGFTLQENAANTTGGAIGVQQMTEFGVALFAASTTNGAQNNTIKNNTITLSSATAYQNAIGVFSTTASSSTNGAQSAASIAGTNSNNKFYTNTVSGVAQGFYFVSPTQTATVFESGNDIGGSVIGQGNNITYGISNTAGDLGFTSYSGTTPAGIYFRNVVGNSARFNTINAVATLTLTSGGIFSASGTAPSGVTYTSNFSDNTITITNTGITAVTGIDFGSGLSTGTIVSSNNSITINQNSTIGVAAAITGLNAKYTAASSTLNTNTITINQAFTPSSTQANTSPIIGLNLPGGTTGTPTITANGNGITINRTSTAGAGITSTMGSTMIGIQATTSATTMTIGAAGAGNANTVTIKEAVAGAGTNTYSSAITYIDANNTHGTLNVVNNTMNTTGSTIRSTGSLICVNQNSTTITLESYLNNTCNVDRIAASGSVFFTSSTNSPSMPSVTATGNNITFTNLAGTTTASGISVLGGPTGAGTKTVSGNTINISGTNTGASKGIAWGYTLAAGAGNLNNNNITINNAATSIVGMDGIGTSPGNATLNNNTLSLTSSATAPTSVIGINGLTTGPFQITNNTFSALNLTGIITGTPVVSAIVVSAGSGNNINNNVISNISVGAATSTASPTVDGILISGGTSTNVFKNKIYGISTLATGTTTVVNGVRISAGTTNTVYNNLIGNLSAAAASSTDALRGIGITSTTASSTQNVYYNSIFLSGSGGANFGSSGIFHTISTTSSTSALNLRNNIIVNTATPSGTGLTVAYRRSAGAASNLANYGGTSNNNDFYAGTPGLANLIYSDGTSSAQTVALYKSGVFTAGTIAPRDSNSFSELPPFLSTSGASVDFLHINTTIATQVESGAAVIAGFTDDYDGNARSGSTPDVGADEFAGIGIDLNAPVISYSLLGNGANGATRAFTNVTITDATGVNGTAGTRPRVYYKKTSDANNTFNDNTSATVGWKFVEANGSTSPFDFTIDYSKLSGGGTVSVADVIQYFVVAQDTAAPTVGINSGTFTVQPSSVALTAAAFPIGGTINTYTIAAAIPATVTVDAGGAINSLTNAGGLFATLNAGVLTQNVTVNITSDLSGELGTNALNQLAEDPVGNYTVTIKASGGAARTITGSSAAGLITLNGADRVTFDGTSNVPRSMLGNPNEDTSGLAPEAAGNNLSIVNNNTGTSSAVIWVQTATGSNGATNNIFRKLNITGNANTTTLLGIGFGGTSISTSSLGTGNNNNRVEGCDIQKAQFGIYSQGASAANKNIGNVITQNIMTAVSPNNIGKGGIQVGFENNVTISQNSISAINTTADDWGITLGVTSWVATGVTGNEVTNASVTGNIIGSVINTGTNSVSGIIVAPATSGTNLIANNSVYGVTGNSTPGDLTTGIFVTGGTGSTTNIYFNSVSMTGDRGSGTTASSLALAIAGTNPVVNVLNNALFNTQTTASTGKSYAIGLGYGAAGSGNFTNLTSNNNDLFTSGANGAFTTITNLNPTTTDLTSLAAWQNAATGTGKDAASISSNPLFNSVTNLQPQTGSPLVGAGTPGTGVLTDILGVTRSVGAPPTGPTIGAYENAIDTVGPVITYSALGNTLSTGDRTLSITVTDTSGVPSSGTGLPVIYYKKNALSYVNTQCVFVSGSSFNCDLLAASMGTLTAGDTVSYYVAAQDNLGNVSVNPSAGAGGFTASPPAAGTPPTTPNSYLIAAAVTGTYTVNAGGGGNALSLTNAGGIFQQINNGVVTGNVTIDITSDLTAETGAFALNEFAPGFTVTIKPSGAARIVSGSSALGLIKLSGADGVTIDGSTVGGTDRSLTLTNTNTAGVTVWVGTNATGGALNDTVKNCNISGSSGTTTIAGVIAGSGTTVGGAAEFQNNNLTIANNLFTKVQNGVFFQGNLATPDTGLVMEDNFAGGTVAADKLGFRGLLVSNAAGFILRRNTVTGVSSSTGSSSTMTGIQVGGSSNGGSVTRNTVKDIKQNNTTGWGSAGIYLANSSTTSNTLIANNFVSDVASQGFNGVTSSDNGYGVMIEIGGGYKIYNNTVVLNTNQGAGAASGITAALNIAAAVTTVGGIDLRNNILANTQTLGTRYAVYDASTAGNTVFSNIDRNDYFAQNVGFLTSARVTLGNWQTATGSDANSIAADPLFVSSTDFHLLSGSPARNTGTTIAAVTDDYDGDARPQEAVYEIGADEYVDSIAPDTTIDSNPTNPSNSASATFTFSGTDSLAPEAVASFECDLDGGGFATCTSPQNYPSLSDGSHTFQVRAKDAGGNVDPTPASFTWVIDATAPNTSITANPTNPSNSSTGAFSFTGTDGSGTGVASFECQIDGGGFSTCTSPVSYPGLSEGSHTFQVRAIDGVGNVDATPASFTWVIDTIAPDTSITANPTNPTNSANASFSFTGSDPGGSGVASFQCQLDGGGYSTCTSPASYPGLSDGSHTFQVRAIDAAGNTDATPATFTWVVDATAPDTSITANPTNPSNSASASFSFTGNDGAGTGVASFECQIDGGGYSTCTSPANYPGLAEGSHTFNVRAIDGAGNTDASPASYTWVVDTVAPTTSITATPPDPSNDNTPTFSFTGNDGSGTGVSGFECRVDSGSYSSCTSPHTTSSLTDGLHTFEVRAIDAAGNTDASPASYTWVTDTAAPNTTIDSSPSNPTSSTSATFTFSGVDSLAAGKGNGTELIIGLTFECQLDGGGYSSCISPKMYTSLGDGSHTFQVRATDTAGNTDPTAATFTWVVDTTAPDTNITANPANPTNSTTGAFSFTGNDGVGTGVASFECQIDGGGYSTCTSPANYPGLSNGSHTFNVRAKDGVNNTDASPASFTWTIDTVAPVIGAYAPLSNTTSTAARVFNVTATDNLAIGTVDVHYSINGGSDLTAACVPAGPPNTWTCTLPGNSIGTAVAYYVSATDTATNIGEGPSSGSPNLYTVGAAVVPGGQYSSLSMFGGSSLGGSVDVLGNLELNGIVTTGANFFTLTCGATVTGAGPSSYINGNIEKFFCSTQTFTFPVGTTPDGLRPDGDAQPEGNPPEYSPMTANITALTVPSSLSVSVDDNFMLGLVQTSAISRTWTVQEIGNVTANMTFTYLDQDINGPEANYKVFKRAGGFTTEQTPNSNNPAANTISVTGVTSFSQWSGGAAVTTAAAASIGGRVTTASGNGIRNAYVTISGNSLPVPIRVQTGSLGWYHFENLAAGETYIIQVGAKRFRFAVPSRVIALQDSLSDVDFVANPQE